MDTVQSLMGRLKKITIFAILASKKLIFSSFCLHFCLLTSGERLIVLNINELLSSFG